MAFYECVFIARQELSTAAVDTLTKDLQKIITDNGGKVHKTENWGLKAFAYRINKQKKGHYVLMELDTPPTALLEMERIMRFNEDVVRNLTIKLDALSKDASVQKVEAA
jgi:small subunit ribosomal protein S6